MRLSERFIFVVCLTLIAAPIAGAKDSGAPIVVAKPMIDDRVASLESDIGRLMQKRVDDSASVPRELELRIDVRIVAAWFAVSAAEAPANSQFQACAWIRCSDLLSAASLVEQQLDGANRRSAGDSPQVKALHDLTFKLPDGKNVSDLDAVSRTAGSALLAILGGDAATARLPQMRPDAGDVESKPAGRHPRSLEQLAARSRELAVSPALRVQLLGFVQAAQKLSQDPKRQSEFSDAVAMLDDAVTLAEGLQSNTAVEREDRVKMEAQVAQGLAMFLDARTRKLGRQHVDRLTQYRKMIATIRDLKLPQDLLKRFGPAMTWARANPDSGDAVMSAIGAFVQQEGRFANSPTPHELSGSFARAHAESKQRASSAREKFLDSIQMGGTFRKPEALRARVEEMKKSLDAADAVARSPEAVRTLNAYRPKPFGGIEKRVQSAMNVLQSESAADADRDATSSFLSRLARLADHGAELNHPATAPAAEVGRAYIGDALEAFQSRRKVIVSELINATAAGKPLDDASLAPLETARLMLAAVDAARGAEQAVTVADVLQQWVDWGVDRDGLNGVMETYRSLTADAFGAFAHMNAAPVDEWLKLRPRYDPLVALLARVANRAEACRALPAGRTGALAKLMTPLADQSFAPERRARVLLDAFSYHTAHKQDRLATATLDALANESSH
jgi:hypothetical protein